MDLSSHKLTNYTSLFSSQLFKNAFYIILTEISTAGFGFIFWLIAAKLYSPSEVGIATAIISSMTLIIILSRFGLDVSLIRFFPKGNKSEILSTSIIVATIISILFSCIFIYGLDFFAPELDILHTPLNISFYLTFVFANSIITMTGISFIAIRKSEYQLLQNTIVGLRVLLLFLFIGLGAMGIFISLGVSLIAALIIAPILLSKSKIIPQIKVSVPFLKESIRFSFANYVTSIFMTAPNMIFSILILNEIASEEAAYYYITVSIASLLFMIPKSIGTSLFVEGSHGESLKRSAIKSIYINLSILIPISVVFYVFAYQILSFIGEDYAIRGTSLLRLMVIASYFVGIANIYFSIKRIQKDINEMLLLSGSIFVLLIGMGYISIHSIGIIGIGYAWIFSYGIATISIISIIWKKKWFEK